MRLKLAFALFFAIAFGHIQGGGSVILRHQGKGFIYSADLPDQIGTATNVGAGYHN